MAKTKLILNGLGLQTNIQLVNANNLNAVQNLAMTPGASVIAGSIQPNGSRVTGPNYIEVQNKSVLDVVNNELPLENIVATSGTIQLNNNYTGDVKSDVQVGNNSIVSLTGIDIPLGTVTIEQEAIFSFTHNNFGMQINTLNGAISMPNLVIKDIHTVVDTANFLNNIFNNVQGFQGNVTEGIAARIYKKNKEAVKLFMTQNNMTCNDVAIDQYFDQKYLVTSALAQERDNWGDFANLSLDVVGNIFSELAYI